MTNLIRFQPVPKLTVIKLLRAGVTNAFGWHTCGYYLSFIAFIVVIKPRPTSTASITPMRDGADAGADGTIISIRR